MDARTDCAYETPVLLDAAELAGTDLDGCGVCITGGGAAAQK